MWWVRLDRAKAITSQEIQKAREEERDNMLKNVIRISVNSFVSNHMIENSISTKPLMVENEKRLQYLVTKELIDSGLVEVKTAMEDNGIKYTASINIIKIINKNND